MQAVHVGEIPDNELANLSDAQDLCRRGILKLLLEGPPRDWVDLILGAEVALERLLRRVDPDARPDVDWRAVLAGTDGWESAAVPCKAL